MATTITQEIVDGLIITIQEAETAGSITNEMLAKILSYLNQSIKTLKSLPGSLQTETSERIAADQSLQNAVDAILGVGDATTAIDSLKELKEFLAGVNNTDTLLGLLNTIRGQLTQHSQTLETLETEVGGKAEAFTVSDDLSMSAARELGLSARLKPEIISSAVSASLKAAAEAAGAVYNEATGYFELNTLTDITTEQMAKILYSPPVLISGHYQVPVGVRTNIAADDPASFWNGGNDMLNLQDIAVNAGNLEVLKLANESKVLFCSSIAHIARGAVKLRKIMGAIRNGAGSNFFTTNAFSQCAALEEVRIHTLNFNVSFSDSPKLSLASLQYMVTNGANNATPITVTVHPTVYAKLTDTANAEWYAVLTAAAAKKISFATTA